MSVGDKVRVAKRWRNEKRADLRDATLEVDEVEPIEPEVAELIAAMRGEPVPEGVYFVRASLDGRHGSFLSDEVELVSEAAAA